jgi:hypothetical protein
MRNWFYLLIVLFCCFCSTEEKKTPPDTIVEGNTSVTFSEDTALLARIINMQQHKPLRVKFKYSFVGNSGGNERITVPGPSDSYLEAVLYFDAPSFLKLTRFVDYSGYVSSGTEAMPYFNKDDFKFEWLDENIKKELMASDTSYHGNADKCFGTNGKLWLLDNKVLLVKSTN